MREFDFYEYDESKEENGIYHMVVLASDEELTNIRADNLCYIIMQVKNPELKEKMKKRLLEYIINNHLTEYDTSILSYKLFNDDEIKMLVSSNNYIQKIQDDINKELTFHKIIAVVKSYFYSSDITWIIDNISKILSIVKEYDFYDSLLVHALELSREKDIELFMKLLSKFKHSIPEYYINYLNINSNHEFLYNRSMEYRNKHLRIGIDPRISIAPEIEANNHYDLKIDFYAQRGFEGKYKTGTEVTVPDGNEINCIPFHDTEEDIASFKAVCDSLGDIGYFYNPESDNAAGQINLGLSYLDSAAAIINFYEIFCNVEELLFYISNKKGDLTRQSLYQNSRFKPIGEIIGKRVLDEDITRDEVIALFNDESRKSPGIKGLLYKKNTICLRGDNEDNYRFEIRIPNGGVDYETWIDNIRLYGKMMEVAKKLADASKKDYLTSEEERLLSLKLELEDDSLSLREKLDILMDLLFTDERIKAIYYERFDSVIEQLENSEDYQIRQKYRVPTYGVDPKFGKVGFQGQYRTRLGDEPVASFDPETGEYIEYGTKKHLR